MDTLRHMAYEIDKGVRALVLYTAKADKQKNIEDFLTRKGIKFFTDRVSSRKINVFFGTPECLRVHNPEYVATQSGSNFTTLTFFTFPQKTIMQVAT